MTEKGIKILQKIAAGAQPTLPPMPTPKGGWTGPDAVNKPAPKPKPRPAVKPKAKTNRRPGVIVADPDGGSAPGANPQLVKELEQAGTTK